MGRIYLWTVVRFPSGHWSTGGAPTDPEYSECEIWQVEARTREEAKKKAQRIRHRHPESGKKSGGAR
jgi:hypothetical protein